MQDMTNAVAAAFQNIVAAGAIEKAIEENLNKTIASIIQDQLKSYSDFGKQLSEHVKKALQVDFDNLGLAPYSDFILKIVRTQVDTQVGNVLAKQVEEQMTKLLQPAPAEIKLSKLIEDFIEHNKPDGCECGGSDRITLHIEESRYGSRWIGLDKDEGKSEYSCEIRFAVSESDGKIFGLRLDGKEADKTLFIGPIYGFERSLFQIYAAGTKLIVDGDCADDFDTYYPGQDD